MLLKDRTWFSSNGQSTNISPGEKGLKWANTSIVHKTSKNIRSDL